MGAAGPAPFGVPMDFNLFGLTLLGVALFHHRTPQVAVSGLIVITIYKLGFTCLRDGPGFGGLVGQFEHESVTLANLLDLLLGFALLANHFEGSQLPRKLPHTCPKRVHVGYIAAIVVASNAGGSGSVVGDTTTTMMWINHVSPLTVVHAFVAAAVALVLVVLVTLATAITVNVRYPHESDRFHFIGVAVWAALLLCIPLRRPSSKAATTGACSPTPRASAAR